MNSNTLLIGFPEGKNGEDSREEFGEAIVENFPEGKKNVSPKLECNCSITSPVLI